MPKFKPRDKKQRRSRSLNGKKTHDGSREDHQTNADPNTLMILPKTADERRQELKAELSQGLSKISNKKQKRLDKYIDKKLKKEERVALIEKLSSERIDTTLLTSTRDLGVTKLSKKEQLRRALTEEAVGINLEANRKLIYEERSNIFPFDKEDEQEGPGLLAGASQNNSDSHPILLPVVGSGLKRSRDVDDCSPVIPKKLKRSSRAVVETQESVDNHELLDNAITDSGPWTGFSTKEEYSSQDGSEDEGGSETDSEVSHEEGTGSEGSSSSDEDSGSGSEGSGESDDPKTRLRRTGGKSERATAFKQWALAQRQQLDTSNEEARPTAPNSTEIHPNINATSAPPPAKGSNEAAERQVNGRGHQVDLPKANRKTFSVNVPRPQEIQEQRLALPVVADEQRIMEAIHNHDVVVLCGETGSGKTTQVPQFLFEAGYGDPSSETPGIIGVTQPRRVAAVSMSRRVGTEMGDLEAKVAYQIRFEGSVNQNTSIKFMTDGVLLREVSEDFLLRKYSAVIIDEAHERSINTDILIGAISRVVTLRREMSSSDSTVKPLKVIIMSATLRVSDFSENMALFSTLPPVVQVDARQHKVTNRFSLRTRPDYVGEAYKKVSKIHRRLPKGGILVFLTGQNEIATLSRKLKAAFNKSSKRSSEPRVQILAKDAALEEDDIDLGLMDSRGLDDIDDDAGSEESDMGEEYEKEDNIDLELVVLPLFSLLNTKDQMRVFEPLGENQRLCVLATNVAETSLTIPGIRYVVDTGRVKERTFDKTTGVQSFDIHWISKASAVQRSGRAGRTGPGQCYRLYSSALFESDFPEFTTPEMQRTPIEGLVLQMKSMYIQNVLKFPFPSPPSKVDLSAAEKLLRYMGALDSDGVITELGRTMNSFPVSPRFSRILTVGHQHDCMAYTIAVVAAMTVGDLFVPDSQLGFDLEAESADRPLQDAPSFSFMIERDLRKAVRKRYFDAQLMFSSLEHTCDFLKILTAVCAYEYEKDKKRFCGDNFVREKAMAETRKMREQLTRIVKANFPEATPPFKAELEPPGHLQRRVLKHIIGIGYIDQVAIRGDKLPNSPINIKGYKNMVDVPYFTLMSTTTGSKVTQEDFLEAAVYVHPSSVLAMHKPKEWPQYIVYSTLQRSTSTSGKVRMKPLTALTGQQLSLLAMQTPLITYSKPLHHPPPKVSAGENGQMKRECWVVPQFGAAIGKAELGWSLPPRRVTQYKEPGSSHWVVQLEQ